MDQIGAQSHEQQHEDTYSAARTAEVLGLGKRRVLQMLERGELPASKDDAGRWLVSASHVHALLREREDQDRGKRVKDSGEASTAPPGEEMRELLDNLKDQVSYLREEMHRREERHAEEIRRRDHLLAAALERIPELEAPRDASGSPEKPAEEPPKGAAPEPHITPHTTTQRRPWWLRILGG